MVIAAYALRVKLSFIYVRGEMVFGAERLALALKEARDRGFLGEKILGTDLLFLDHSTRGSLTEFARGLLEVERA